MSQAACMTLKQSWVTSMKDGVGPKQRHWQAGHEGLAKPLHVAFTNMKQVFLDLKYFLHKAECKGCVGKISHWAACKRM